MIKLIRKKLSEYAHKLVREYERDFKTSTLNDHQIFTLKMIEYNS